ncbi:MAG: indolepyruvate oxidoreductase subunit beta [Dehalococcoidia bacterium]|nr:indolepyruvate oxidoreductase subunit beta [Dehalococcoidia bacterium]
MMKKLDILMVGVGGQGNVLASDILSEVAIAAGYDVKKTDTLGMAQRGGSVVSQVRIADKVWSPLIKDGEVDILVALEKLEVVRWSHHLHEGSIAIVNHQTTPPLSVSLGTHRYPSDKEVEAALKRWGSSVYFVDGTSQAKELGDIRMLNILMLGCLSFFMPIDVKIWKGCISQRLSPKLLKMNMVAFDKGREEMSRAGIG